MLCVLIRGNMLWKAILWVLSRRKWVLITENIYCMYWSEGTYIVGIEQRKHILWVLNRETYIVGTDQRKHILWVLIRGNMLWVLIRGNIWVIRRKLYCGYSAEERWVLIRGNMSGAHQGKHILWVLIRGNIYCGYSSGETYIVGAHQRKHILWVLSRGNIYCGCSSEETCSGYSSEESYIVGTQQREHGYSSEETCMNSSEESYIVGTQQRKHGYSSEETYIVGTHLRKHILWVLFRSTLLRHLQRNPLHIFLGRGETRKLYKYLSWKMCLIGEIVG